MLGRLGLLREYDFRQLFVADTVSQVGSQVSLLALPLVAVLVLGASNLEVGVLAACGTLAFLLVGLPAGAWVDRLRRRGVLIVADVGRALVLGSVPLAWVLGVLSMPQLYLVAVVTGVLTVFFDMAYQSYLPHLVGRERLVEGNAKLEAVRAVGQVAGPSGAGLAVQVLTAPVAVAVDAVSFLGSALFVGRIRSRETRRCAGRARACGPRSWRACGSCSATACCGRSRSASPRTTCSPGSGPRCSSCCSPGSWAFPRARSACSSRSRQWAAWPVR